jgi:hypothetical protein
MFNYAEYTRREPDLESAHTVEVRLWNEADQDFSVVLEYHREFNTLAEANEWLRQECCGTWWSCIGVISVDGIVVHRVRPGRGQIAHHRAMYGI